MKSIIRIAALASVAWSASALAGDEVLYRATPGWVDVAPMPEAAKLPSVVIFDQQVRIEGGTAYTYLDMAFRADSPQTLNSIGTVQADWLPDKGDLTVHRVEIIRDGEVIDVLGQGAKFEILRRETELEQRSLDGILTAALAVPGLRVGDVLRVTYTVSSDDQGLGDRSQSYIGLLQAPLELGFGRARVSWPAGAQVNWKATDGIADVPVTTLAGGNGVEVMLPIAKSPPMPADAPNRYRMSPMLQAGNFTAWSQVSDVFAPLYATQGTIAAGSPLAGIVSGIRAQSNDPLTQAMLALEVVQDDVSYLLNGMDGGNYMPQSPADTWELRYGDCKAKTYLLLAMLHDMGIEAVPVAVSSSMGDSLPYMLPMPGAFDHVLVRATIDGRHYWLDGTSTGASLVSIEEVPAFEYGLPLVVGADALVALEQRPQLAPDLTVKVQVDQRAGIAAPALVAIDVILTGQMGGEMAALVGEPAGEQMDTIMQGLGQAYSSDFSLLDYSVTQLADGSGIAIRLNGVAAAGWEWTRGNATHALILPSEEFSFKPDRARKAWQDIPVAVGGPYTERVEMTFLLPEGSAPYTVEGKDNFDTTLATVRLQRQTTIEPGKVVVVDQRTTPGGEIAAGDIPAYRTEAARFGSLGFKLKAPADVADYFAITTGDPKRFAAVEKAMDSAIAKDPDDVAPYRSRAAYRVSRLDWKGALADLTTVINLEGGADDYLTRAAIYQHIGDDEKALADVEAAFDLQPGADMLVYRADLMSQLGMDDEAFELLATWDGASGDEERSIAVTMAEIEAKQGRAQEGLARVDELAVTRPGDPEMMNARCWYMATWNVAADEMLATCTEAVEKSEWSANALDSRGVANFRLGRYAEAKADFDAALAVSPDLTASLYMRGLTRLAMGDKGGAEDIALAKRMFPSVEEYYAKWGLVPE